MSIREEQLERFLSQLFSTPVTEEEKAQACHDLRLESWLYGRPDAVKVVARKYPPGTRIDVHGVLHHVVSYEEQDDGGVGLGASPIDPSKDYDGAVANRVYICPDHLLESATP